MRNIYLEAFAISAIYVIFSLFENKYLNKDKAFKDVVKEGLAVYVAVICGIFAVEQFTPAIKKIAEEGPPPVFIDNPPF